MEKKVDRSILSGAAARTGKLRKKEGNNKKNKRYMGFLKTQKKA